MPSKHLILCHPLLLLPPTFPSIRVFSNESALCIRWPKYWSFSISPSSEYSGMISFRIDWSDLLAVQGALKSLLQSSLRECGCAPALRRVRECGCALARHRVPAGSLNFAPGKKKKKKSLLQHHSLKASILQCSTFLMVQLSHLYVTTGKTIALTMWTFVGKLQKINPSPHGSYSDQSQTFKK